MTNGSDYQRARLLLTNRRPRDAEIAIRQHLAHSPEDPWAHNVLSSSLFAQKKVNESIRAGKDAISFAPDEAYFHYSLAHIYYCVDMFGDCEKLLKTAIELDPTAASYWGLKANLHMAYEDWKATLTAAETGLTHDPTHIHCKNLRALALSKLKKKDAAVSTFSESLQQDPENALTFAYQGWMHVDHGEAEQAITSFSEALRIEPTNEWARTGLFHALRERHLLFALARKLQKPMIVLFSWLLVMPLILVGVGFAILAKSHHFLFWIPAIVIWTCMIVLILLLALPLNVSDSSIKAFMLFDKRGKYLLTPSERRVATFTWIASITVFLLVFFGKTIQHQVSWFVPSLKFLWNITGLQLLIALDLFLLGSLSLRVWKGEYFEQRQFAKALLITLVLVQILPWLAYGFSIWMPGSSLLISLVVIVIALLLALSKTKSGTTFVLIDVVRSWVDKHWP